MIVRTIQQHIESKMFKGKVMIVYGARQIAGVLNQVYPQ